MIKKSIAQIAIELGNLDELGYRSINRLTKPVNRWEYNRMKRAQAVEAAVPKLTIAMVLEKLNEPFCGSNGLARLALELTRQSSTKGLVYQEKVYNGALHSYHYRDQEIARRRFLAEIVEFVENFLPYGGVRQEQIWCDRLYPEWPRTLRLEYTWYEPTSPGDTVEMRQSGLKRKAINWRYADEAPSEKTGPWIKEVVVGRPTREYLAALHLAENPSVPLFVAAWNASELRRRIIRWSFENFGTTLLVPEEWDGWA